MTMPQPADSLWTRVICKQPDRYIGWPSIARLKSGELLIVFSGDRDSHVCPWGKTHLISSCDDGESWSAADIIRDSPLDDRDAGIIETANGTLLASWITTAEFEQEADYEQHAATINTATRERWLGSWVQRSENGGQTWNDPIRVESFAPHGPVQLSDGRLLYLGNDKGDRQVIAEESTDDGRSWKVIGTVSHAPETAHRGLGEPHLVEAADGKLIGLFRIGGIEPDDRFVFQSTSDDGGHTWTPARTTSMLGFPPHAVRLQDDRLLVVYGLRMPPFGQRACISEDGGFTWDVAAERVFPTAPNADLGYPASVQLADGSILTIYYQVDQKGAKPCLMGTKWRL